MSTSRTRTRALSQPPPLSKGKHVDRVGLREDLDEDDSPGIDIPESQMSIHRGWRKWLAGIAKRRKLRPAKDHLVEICDSVFAPFEPRLRGHSFSLRTLDHAEPIEPHLFVPIVASIRIAIQEGRHPRLNLAGSSGSYIVRDEGGAVAGIFKPKDEEPYGRMNPKWIKWFHRILLSVLGVGFGRSCLIPNLSYLSEAAASLLDRKLDLHMVPYTDIASFSSPSFYYDWVDRRAAHRKKKPKPLPEKIGSLQLFAHGFKDASAFLSQHEWPGRLPDDAINLKLHRARRRRQQNRLTKFLFRLRREDPVDEDIASIETLDAEQIKERLADETFAWNAPLMEDFRIELEKLVVLDVLMRNTDRGLDNFMIKHCPAANSRDQRGDRLCPDHEHVHLAAIDNSLAFPHKHPTGWRNYTYGWLWLPHSLIGQSFTQATRDHFLPILTSPHWWSEVTRDLRKLFSVDPDFSEKMFRRQLSIIKGQAYNIVLSLQDQGDGPIELCERRRCRVWDDYIEIADVPDKSRRIVSDSYGRPLMPLRHHSSGTRRYSEESLLPRKLAIKERLEEVHQMPFFRSC